MLLAASGNPWYWLPPDLSVDGWQVDRLIQVLHVFMALLFVGWGVFFVYCLLKFRARPGHRANPEPIKAAASKYVEIAVALFEVVLLLGFSMPVWARVKTEFPEASKALQVRVVAQQFAWNFHYAGPDGVFGKTDTKFMDETANPVGLDPNDSAGADDIVTPELFIPTGKPIVCRLSSKDVIHCFWIPVLRVKQDVVPGMLIPIHFEAKDIGKGEYDITCAQLCGNNHFKMRSRVHIKSPTDFEKWMAEQKLPAEPATSDEDFQS